MSEDEGRSAHPAPDAKTDDTRHRRFHGSFTQQDPLPQASIDAAMEVLATSRLHRYNLMPGETGEAAALEADYAAWQGKQYCLAVTSGGQALQIALRAAGVQPGDTVLSNAFTLAPVTGAIAATGGRTVLVEIDEDLCINCEDLERKARQTGARYLLLSHMRGHIPDMDRVMTIARTCNLTVIEDCAHTMGARWNGERSGNHGHAACFSTQTYKHANSGEGGLLVSDDADLMARATVLSGSYMLYERHGAGPDLDAFLRIREHTPNMSARMDTLRAAILRPQLPLLDEKVAAWNRLHDAVADAMRGANGIALPKPLPGALRVGSSFQFRVPDFDAKACDTLVRRASADGVELKWFGRPEPLGFTSTHRTWRYLDAQSLPQTDRILSTLFDLRLPLTFSVADGALIGAILRDLVAGIGAEAS